jgi:uncharacterized membrane protein YhiD involved in acid resistance
MTSKLGVACVIGLVVLLVAPRGGHAQPPPAPVSPGASVSRAPSSPANDAGQESAETKKPKKSLFPEDGPVDTTWEAQVESFEHALVRLPVAAILSGILAFRPRRRGTPTRQAPVIQTQIVLALVGAMVMMVVGASLARAFGIVGAAGLIRYRAKVEDPKDAGVMLSTLAIGLASGVGLFLFALFAAAFVLGVLLIIESIDPEPYALFDLSIATKDSTGLKESIEGVLRRRRIRYELRSTAAEEICYEVKLPLDVHTDKISEALMGLKAAQSLNVKWEQKKDTK